MNSLSLDGPKQMTSREAQKLILSEVNRLRQSIGIQETLSDRGVHRTDIKELVGNALRDPCLVTNPRSAKKRDIEVIYEEAL